MRIQCIARILVLQFSVWVNVHWSCFFLRPRINAQHSCILSPLSSVFAKHHWIKHHGATVHIWVLLSSSLTAHLHVVVLAHDDVAIDFLNNPLLNGWHLLSHFWLFRDLIQVFIIVLWLILISDALHVVYLIWIFAVSFGLGLFLKHSSVVVTSVSVCLAVGATHGGVTQTIVPRGLGLIRSN